jgi:hypothetical protein
MAGRPSITSDYLSVILRAIEKAQNDPAQLRTLIYDLARLSLGKHVLTNYHQLGSEGLQRQVHSLEAAINQAESLAQKSDAVPNIEELLLARSADSLESTAVTVRDSFGDSIFGDAWSNNELVVSPPAPVKAYRDGCAVTEVLRPVEIWQPTFGHGPKRTRSDFWWSVQLASAALIGVGIYAVMLVHSDFFSPIGNYSIAAPVPSAAVASPGPNTSIAANVASVKAHPSLGFPLPSVYGVYAVSAGKLYELDQLAMRVPDPRVRISAMISDPSHVTVPDGKLSFVIFRRDLAASAPIDVFVRVIAQVQREMKFNGNGPPTITKVDGQWAVRSKSYQFRVAPLAANPEMIVLRAADTESALPPGRYALVLGGQGYDFAVAGQVTDTAHCLESSDIVGGTVYSECRSLAASP